MGYLPIFLDVTGRRCVVIGGGEVAERKVTTLLDAGALVRVVSPSLNEKLRTLAENGAIEHVARRWQDGDLKGSMLAFAATDDRELHPALAAEARALGIPLNVADELELCDFIAPSILRRGDLQIAISTSGASPALASRIRRDLENVFGPEYAALTAILRAARKYLRAQEPEAVRRASILQSIARSDIADRIRDNDWIAVDHLVNDLLGVTLATLGITMPEGPTENHRPA
jgi:precorrin-2 dehydrogenase/sirohydrochlorin ferrochelatase